jgi:hypothetical protein
VNAGVLSDFLGLLSTGMIELDDWLSGVSSLVRFMVRWDCHSAIATLAAHIEVGVWRKTVRPEKAFMVAAMLNDHKMAHAAVRVGAHSKWEQERNPPPGSAVGLQYRFDPQSWSLGQWEDWCEINNHKYLWALFRAHDDLVGGDMSELADRFAEHLATLSTHR